MHKTCPVKNSIVKRAVNVVKGPQKNHFLVKLIVRLPFCPCCVIAAAGFVAPLGPRALGFNGDSTGPRESGPGPGGDVVLTDISPVTFLLIPGRLLVVGRPTRSLWSLCLSNSGKLEKDVMSVPRACLRDFSCLDWTERKCCKSSCHLISSRTSFERLDRGPTVLTMGDKNKRQLRISGRTHGLGAI